jgi:hypothetical protein
VAIDVHLDQSFPKNVFPPPFRPQKLSFGAIKGVFSLLYCTQKLFFLREIHCIVHIIFFLGDIDYIADEKYFSLSILPISTTKIIFLSHFSEFIRVASTTEPIDSTLWAEFDPLSSYNHSNPLALFPLNLHNPRNGIPFSSTQVPQAIPLPSRDLT